MTTMTCTELVDLILDFVGQELEPARRAVFEEHLCGCSGCTVHVEMYVATITVSRALPHCDGDRALPPGLEDRLRAAVAANC